jgi:hypothetical protein
MWNLYGVNMVLKQIFFQHRRIVCQIDFISGIASFPEIGPPPAVEAVLRKVPVDPGDRHMGIVVAVDPGELPARTYPTGFPAVCRSGRLAWIRLAGGHLRYRWPQV